MIIVFSSEEINTYVIRMRLWRSIGVACCCCCSSLLPWQRVKETYLWTALFHSLVNIHSFIYWFIRSFVHSWCLVSHANEWKMCIPFSLSLSLPYRTVHTIIYACMYIIGSTISTKWMSWTRAFFIPYFQGLMILHSHQSRNNDPDWRVLVLINIQ